MTDGFFAASQFNLLLTFIQWAKRTLKKCWMPLAIVLIIIALFFSVFRALTPWAKQYKGEVEQHLSVLIGQPVTINSMETSWYWFLPVLKLNQVTLEDSKEHVLKLSKLMVGINLMSSLWHWHIEPGLLYVDDVHLILRQMDHHWQVDGLRQDKTVTTLDSDAYLPLSALNLTSTNSNGHYRFKGEVKLAQTMATELLIMADMQLRPEALAKASGHAYFSVRRFLPKQWQLFFPKASYHLDGGRGDFEVWLDLWKGSLSGLQTKLNFRRVEWGKYGDPQSQFIQSLKANVAWMPTADGWQLSADQIKLRASGITWPDNALMVKHNGVQHTDRLFVKSLLVEPLLATTIEWPQIMQPVLALHPKGVLRDTQIGLKEGLVNQVLTRFDDLSWQSWNQLPAVSHLSGVVSWQPTAGRLALDAENTSIALRGKKPITFTQVNAALQWKTDNPGSKISVGRFILTNKDLVLSARGELNEPFVPEARYLDLNAEFIADNVRQWLAYLPKMPSKPRLEHWLKHEVKHLERLGAELTFNGKLMDFPFDHQAGKFEVHSHISGMNFYFNKDWPMIRDFDSYLHINKRALEADVTHATLNGMVSEHINFHVDDMGSENETLLLHGQMDVPASKLKSYILVTPLKRRLSQLEKWDIKGNVGLDLNLDVPLDPKNNDVFAKGTLNIQNNSVIFDTALNHLTLSDLNGDLHFNELSVTDSDLKGRLFGEPLDIHFDYVREPQPYTQIDMKGQASIDALSKTYPLAIFSLMKGQVDLISKITVPDDPKSMNHFELRSSLTGASLDLPQPFAKSAEEMAPLSVQFDSHPEKPARLRMNYDDRVKSDIWFAHQNGSLSLDKGMIYIGTGELPLAKRKGLQVVGQIDNLDVEQWHKVWNAFNTHSSESIVSGATSVDLKLRDVLLWGKHYPDSAIQATQINKDEWAFTINQRDIACSLRYQITSNTLSGDIKHLHLAPIALIPKSDVKVPHSALKPIDIPNLDVRMDSLTLGEIKAGEIELKSSSSPQQFHLEYCKVKTPEYLLTLSGDWKQVDQKNKTDIQADLQITDLAKGLERWKITPALEAHKGNIQFQGGWPGAINDFSLPKIQGNVYMKLQNGRITHLSKETEEKLGLGKLLSVLSLQTIPRRLKLDFSDLSSGGYSYDEFKGNFVLNKGVLNTSDSYIDGPVAFASMKGDLDVVKQLYNIDLHISPHITASLPLVATIAGGPVAGIAVWAASKIINQGMQQVTGYTYKISGPWLNPVVKQVNIFKKQVQRGRSLN